jgi:hypothetical protein
MAVPGGDAFAPGTDQGQTDPSQVGRSIEDVVADLNPILRGWAEYFRHGVSSKQFQRINEYVHLRLATYMSRKHGRKGLGWTGRYDYAWFKTVGVYHLSGTMGATSRQVV